METEDCKQKNKENRRHIETKHDNMHPLLVRAMMRWSPCVICVHPLISSSYRRCAEQKLHGWMQLQCNHRVLRQVFSIMALICSAAEVFQKMHSSLYSEDRYLYAQAVWLHWWNRSDKNRVEKYNLAHGPWHRHVPCTPTEKTKTTKRQLDERMNDRQIGNIYLPHHTAGPVLVDPSSWTPRSWDTMVTRMSPCSKGRTSKAVRKHIDRYKYQGRKMMIWVSLSHINQDLLLPPAYRLSNLTESVCSRDFYQWNLSNTRFFAWDAHCDEER